MASKLTIVELKKILSEKNISIPPKSTKADLVKLVENSGFELVNYNRSFDKLTIPELKSFIKSANGSFTTKHKKEDLVEIALKLNSGKTTHSDYITINDALFIDGNGRVCCFEHLGMTASANVKADFKNLTKTSVKTWTGLNDEPIYLSTSPEDYCETCKPTETKHYSSEESSEEIESSEEEIESSEEEEESSEEVESSSEEDEESSEEDEESSEEEIESSEEYEETSEEIESSSDEEETSEEIESSEEDEDFEESEELDSDEESSEETSFDDDE